MQFITNHTKSLICFLRSGTATTIGEVCLKEFHQVPRPIFLLDVGFGISLQFIKYSFILILSHGFIHSVDPWFLMSSASNSFVSFSAKPRFGMLWHCFGPDVALRARSLRRPGPFFLYSSSANVQIVFPQRFSRRSKLTNAALHWASCVHHATS